MAALLISCTDNHRAIKTPEKNSVSYDLDSIRKRGKLIAVTALNSTDYFLYKGEPMGFNYEMLKSFADHIGIDVEIVNDNSPEHASDMLRNGEADLVTMGLNSASPESGGIQFTQAVEETRMALVQRKPPLRKTAGQGENSVPFIIKEEELKGKTIYVQKGSSVIERLHAFEREIGDTVRIVEVPYEPEKLIQNVAEGEIDFTVCEENLAIVNSSYYSRIDVSTGIGQPAGVSWGIRKNHSDALMTELNHWIAAYKMTQSYSNLYTKYFKNLRPGSLLDGEYYAISSGKVSPYDDMIRKYSALIQWDWRLLASLIFQESRFQADVISVAGAYGLMQIMPITGRNFGIDITQSPENNLLAGIKYINWLHSIFDPKISDKNERLHFILGAYNAGPGHILDAMKLAEKNGMDPHKWDGNVAFWLLKKSEPQYYNDSVVKNGYFKGKESVDFVSRVLYRYEMYKNEIPVVKKK